MGEDQGLDFSLEKPRMKVCCVLVCDMQSCCRHIAFLLLPHKWKTGRHKHGPGGQCDLQKLNCNTEGVESETSKVDRGEGYGLLIERRVIKQGAHGNAATVGSDKRDRAAYSDSSCVDIHTGP